VLQPGETVTAGVERIARHGVQEASMLLAVAGGASDEAVHEARKHLRRVRGLLRLLAGQMPAEQWRTEQARYRAAARALAGSRDAAVLVATLDGLAGRPDGPVDPDAVHGLRDLLVARHRAAREQLPAQGAVARDLLAGSSAAPWTGASDLLAEATGTPLAVAEPPGGVRIGLVASARRARRAFTTARAAPTAVALHTWRKRSKDLRPQIEVLAPARPDVLEPLAGALHDLTDLLGEHHDLAVLDAVAAGAPRACMAVSDLAALRAAIAVRSREHALAALALGSRLHAERPGAFADRILGYVDAWQRHATTGQGPR
jgi:CHAD domain-containing protein